MAVSPLQLRRFSMVRSFLLAADDALDQPVFRELRTHISPGTDSTGQLLPPNELARKMQRLTPADSAQLVSSCCIASTNLGYAYEHAFRLLADLVPGSRPTSPEGERAGLDALYDALPDNVRKDLDTVYTNVSTHEFEFQEGDSSQFPDFGPGTGSSPFRQNLNYWQSAGLLRESHGQYAYPSTAFFATVLMPFRSLEVVDCILADVLAPRLGLKYRRVTGHSLPESFPPGTGPKLEWTGETVQVSLPDKRGRIIEARWKPTATSIVRIREQGQEDWSLGFATPLNTCSFAGLKPGVRYDVEITSRDEKGEEKLVAKHVLVGPQLH